MKKGLLLILLFVTFQTAWSQIYSGNLNHELIDHYINNGIDSVDENLRKNYQANEIVRANLLEQYKSSGTTYLPVKIDSLQQLILFQKKWEILDYKEIRYCAFHVYFMGVEKKEEYVVLDKDLNIVTSIATDEVREYLNQFYEEIRREDSKNSLEEYALDYRVKDVNDISTCKAWLKLIYSKAHKVEGDRLVRKSKFEESNESYNKALLYNPVDYNVIFNIGNNYAYMRKYNKGMKYFDQVIEANYEDLMVMSYYNRGVSYFYNKKNKKAVVELTNALNLDKNYFMAYYVRGWAYSIMNEYKKGKRDYTAALQINPKHGDSYYRRALAKFLSGDEPGYLEDLYLAVLYGSAEAAAYVKSSDVTLPKSLFTSNAEFVYGATELDSFITDNLVRPKDCIEGKWEFDIYFQYTVEEDGNVSSIKVDTIQSLSVTKGGHSPWVSKMMDTIIPILENEIKRVMEFSSGLWIPKVDGDKGTWQVLKHKYELRVPEYYERAQFKHMGMQAVGMPYHLPLDVGAESAPKYYNLGVKKIGQKKYLLAIKYFMKSAMLDPTNSDTFYNLGVTYYLNGNKKKACQTWKKAASMQDEEAKLMLENNCKY